MIDPDARCAICSFRRAVHGKGGSCPNPSYFRLSLEAGSTTSSGEEGEQRAGDEFDAEEQWIATYQRLLRNDDRLGRWGDDTLGEIAEQAWRKHADFRTPEKAYAIAKQEERL